MKNRSLVVAGIVALAICSAQVAKADFCPALGYATGCNIVITIDSSGVASVAQGSATTPYDGTEDQYIGVVNNWNQSVTSIALTGNSIFAFDSDGAFSNSCLTASGGTPAPCGSGGSGYGGPGVSFNIVDGNNGTVLFGNGGIAAGTQGGFFSLEENFQTGNVTGGGVNLPTPEPGSLILLGTGFLGMAGAVRRKLNK